MSRKRKALSFKEKLDILRKVDEDPKRKRTELAKELGLATSTLSTVVGQRETIMKNVLSFNVNAKQAKTAQHVKLEETLLTWFKEVTAAGVNIDGKVLREKADEFALALHIDGFQASEYEPRDVFNADEAGLFFNLQPEKSLCLKGKACRGGKKSKERITVLLCCNADGSEKLKLTVVGKFQKPRCLKRESHLPCVYRANKKAWMTAALFEEFLSLLDRRMACKNRKILLFLDQCAAHPRQVTLQNVKLVFLPANATTHLQPLDAGIIKNVKHHFKSFLVRRLLAKIDRKDEGDLKISLLDAIHFIAMAWDRVTPTTVANCFGKCGFFGSPEEVPPEPEDPTIEDWEQLNVECTSDDFCTADDDLATCGTRTVEDIVEEAACGAADSSDDGDDIDVGDGEGPPPAAETLHALDVLRRAVAADEVSDDTCRRFYAFEQSLLGDLAKKETEGHQRLFHQEINAFYVLVPG
ncbi:hypothetical protein HPB51_002840 [Rhipicephalus microplus]|uniref:Tick transposon n=1 Tax=Rhipicephalus microplus TaxID=6941 RepID=A0A9J6EXM0_RHIMP|nr:hypothetical protein HPB51_002840 [Rhipicephalus microplus]